VITETRGGKSNGWREMTVSEGESARYSEHTEKERNDEERDEERGGGNK